MSELHLLRPWWLLALLPALLLLVSLWRGGGGRSAWRSVIDRQLLQRLWLEPPGAVSRQPLVILALAWLLAIVALAGPVWEQRPEAVWRTQAPRVILLDLSASMDAADLPPSRLARARFKVLDILAAAREGRIGLVVFAGEPHPVVPLTDDDATIANLLGALSTDIVPAPGDAVAPALRMALDLLRQSGARQGDLLLLSDGVADPAAALTVARELRLQGHRLSVLAVGTDAGAPIPAADGGFAGMARTDPAPLRELAAAGGGRFSRLTNDDSDLAQVLLAPRRSGAVQDDEGKVDSWVEHGVWLLPLLVLLGAVGFRRGWLSGLLLVLILPPPAEALQWRDLWLRPDQQAARDLQRGRAAEAAGRFEDPAWRGTALYRAGDYRGAAAAFSEIEDTESRYNLGNALARSVRLSEAAAVYRRVLARSPEHTDARVNLALVEKLLQQQQQQQKHAAQRQPVDTAGQQSGSLQPRGQENRQPRGAGSDPQRGGRQEETAYDQAAGDPNPAEERLTEPPENNESQQPSAARQARSNTGRAGTNQAGVSASTLPDEARFSRQLNQDGRHQVSTEPPGEAALALEQWLRQIPEDPAGLLRRKFMLEHLQRQQE